MKIKPKLILTLIAIGGFLPGIVFAHSGHGRAETNIFHYLVDHAGNYFIWLSLLVFVLVLLRIGAKNK